MRSAAFLYFGRRYSGPLPYLIPYSSTPSRYITPILRIGFMQVLFDSGDLQTCRNIVMDTKHLNYEIV